MTLLQLLVVLLIAGVIIAMFPIDPLFRKLAVAVAAIAVLLVLLSYAGIF